MATRPLSRFSIRESDRCLETIDLSDGERAALEFQYPRVGSLPRNWRRCCRTSHLIPVSVSASRIVASKLPWLPVDQEPAPRFSIRESDRCLETDATAPS